MENFPPSPSPSPLSQRCFFLESTVDYENMSCPEMTHYSPITPLPWGFEDDSVDLVPETPLTAVDLGDSVPLLPLSGSETFDPQMEAGDTETMVSELPQWMAADGSETMVPETPLMTVGDSYLDLMYQCSKYNLRAAMDDYDLWLANGGEIVDEGPRRQPMSDKLLEIIGVYCPRVFTLL